MTKRSEKVTSPAGNFDAGDPIAEQVEIVRIGSGGSETILSGVSRSASRDGWTLS